MRLNVSARFAIGCKRLRDCWEPTPIEANLERVRGKAKTQRISNPHSSEKYVRRRTKLYHPVICVAGRFLRRYHVRDSGEYPITGPVRNLSPAERSLREPGSKINPTRITACVEQWGTRRDVEISLEDALQHDDWCPECRALVESIVTTRKIRSELEGTK